MNQPSPTPAIRNRRGELLAVAVFLVVTLVGPAVVGELYPFTVSPMFCDQPARYCTYELTDEAGRKVDPEPFGLHLVYDGNPPGMGMGIEATPRMHSFGEVPDLKQVAEHVRSVADDLNVPGQLTIRQTVVCCEGTKLESRMRETIVRPGDDDAGK